MKEPEFQKIIIDEIKKRLPNVIVLKNDPNYMQGIPDLSIFYFKKWALLEVKMSSVASHQPNQDYYINWAKTMGYGAFIYPSVFEEVLNDMCIYLKS